MTKNTDYSWVLEQYPDIIHKEQFYKICHISKRTALLLLESGIIPCIKTGKKTRQYSILTKHVVDFLEGREREPGKYKLPEGSYSQDRKTWHPKADHVISRELVGPQAESFYRTLLKSFPDVLSVVQTAEATGYSQRSVIKWCHDGYLSHFLISGVIKIPKISFLEFMCSDHFGGVRCMTESRRTKLLSLLAIVGQP